MEYDLTRLSASTFDEMCRELIQKQFGPAVSQFGNGPDGGREAIDRIDPVSWGASAEIRSGLWRTMRRSPVAKAILHVD